MQSGIHGWGLVARTEVKQDSMIIEYRGEALRRCMADFRERIYRAKDMDCYLFNINDGVVVDATMNGTIGRFTVSGRLLFDTQIMVSLQGVSIVTSGAEALILPSFYPGTPQIPLLAFMIHSSILPL